jgi:hypothetical protein
MLPIRCLETVCIFCLLHSNGCTRYSTLWIYSIIHRHDAFKQPNYVIRITDKGALNFMWLSAFSLKCIQILSWETEVTLTKIFQSVEWVSPGVQTEYRWIANQKHYWLDAQLSRKLNMCNKIKMILHEIMVKVSRQIGERDGCRNSALDQLFPNYGARPIERRDAR